jgi:hypothetical protein
MTTTSTTIASTAIAWAIGAITYHNALVVGDTRLPDKAIARARG